jgi:hypothetical protein
MTTGSSDTRIIEYEGGVIRRNLARVSPVPTIEQQLRFGGKTLGLSPEELCGIITRFVFEHVPEVFPVRHLFVTATQRASFFMGLTGFEAGALLNDYWDTRPPMGEYENDLVNVGE